MKKNTAPVVVSFYAPGTKAEMEAEELIASCKKFGLSYDIQPVADKGSMASTMCHKPAFLLEMLEKHDAPLIWTNPSSQFCGLPTLLLSATADIALRINDHVSFEDPMKFMTATVFFNNTTSVKKLLDLWQKECEKGLKKNSDMLDQDALRKVLLHYPTLVEIKRLPLTYYWNTEEKPKEGKEIVVRHLTHSFTTI